MVPSRYCCVAVVIAGVVTSLAHGAAYVQYALVSIRTELIVLPALPADPFPHRLVAG